MAGWVSQAVTWVVSSCMFYLKINSDNHTIKGILHLNIIFSYMKFNKICNLDHPACILQLFILVFCEMYI